MEQRQKETSASSAGNNKAAGDSYWENFQLDIILTVHCLSVSLILCGFL